LKKFFKMEKDFVFKIIDELGITLSAAERDSIQQIPTRSYLAFLAYSRGVDYRSRSMMGDSQREFNRAAKIDWHFQVARDQAAAVSQTGTEGTGKEGSIKEFESAVGAETASTEAGTGLAGQLNTVIDNSGVVPGGYFTGGVLAPNGMINTQGTATVIIRGNPDAK